MNIKNRYNQLRFYISWKYPLFYDRICAAKFPLQLLALCLATLLAVRFYNAHYSFNASLKNYHKANSGIGTPTVVAGDLPESEQLIVTTASNRATSQNTSRSPNLRENTPDQLEATLTRSEEVLQQQVTKAEALLQQKKQQTNRLEEKVESAKVLLSASNENTQVAAQQLQNADWLEQQPENHYVVQVAAATEQQILLDYAADKDFKAPLVIYPFKVNKDGELVYGLSTGLFIAQDDAIAELPVLSKISEQHGVWVRKVADIKGQLSSLKLNRIVQ